MNRKQEHKNETKNKIKKKEEKETKKILGKKLKQYKNVTYPSVIRKMK